MEKDKRFIKEQISKAVYEYNRKIQYDGVAQPEAMDWLINQKHIIEDEAEREYGFRMDFGFSFLYPDYMFKVAPTYEEHRKCMDSYKNKYLIGEYEKLLHNN